MSRKLVENFGFNDDEKQLCQDAKTGETANINESRVISEIYFIKKLEQMTNRIVESNENLSKSNKKYVKGMLWLTGGLVFVGIIQIILYFINIIINTH